MLAFAWMDRNRSAPSRLAIAVRLFEGNEGIDASRQHDLESVLFRQKPFQSQRDIEHQVGLCESFRLGTWVVASVACIDHDSRHPQPELP